MLAGADVLMIPSCDGAEYLLRGLIELTGESV